MYCWWAPNSLAICSFRASAKDCSAIGPPVRDWVPSTVATALGPTKPGWRRGRLQRARREPVGHARVVVAGRRDVVRGVGVKQRSEVLDLLTSDTQLALATAVDGDSLALAILIDREELFQGAEARWLGVDRRRLVLEALHVGQRVKRRVPRHAVHVRLQDRPGLVVDVGILEIGVGKRLRDGPIELRVGLDVDGRAPVETLQIEDVHRRQLVKLGDQRLVPVIFGVELEPQRRVLLQPLADRLRGGATWIGPEDGQARGADEAQRPGLPPHDLPEWLARLAKREVKRRALERPAPVVA